MNGGPRSYGKRFKLREARTIWGDQRALRDASREPRRCQGERDDRRIVGLGHTWRLQWHAGARRWRRSDNATVIDEHPCEIFKRDAAVSQEARSSITVKGDDAGLNADLRRLAKQHGVNAPIKLLEHVVGGGGGESSEAIRTWRSDRRSSSAKEGERRFVSRQAHTDRLETSADQSRNLGSRRGNDRQCTWPESIRKEGDTRIGEGVLSEEARKVGTIGNVHDQWIKGWAPLCLKDPGNRWGIEGVRSESVHGFGGKGDKPTCANDCCGARHRFRSGVCGACAQAFGDHAGRARSIISAA